MLKEFADYFMNSVKIDYEEIGGRTYASRQFVPVRPPTAGTLKFNTLAGLAEFAKMKAAPDHSFIHVLSHSAVSVLGMETDEWDQRDMFAAASLDQHPEVFPFGKYLDTESFIVGMQSLFVDTPHRAHILQLSGCMSAQSSLDVEDDGVTQTVGQKAGVLLKSRATLPPNIVLAPYRTFREAEQPQSTFIVRARKNHNSEMPELALFEADGGAWKLQAIANVAKVIKAALPGWQVLA